MAKNAVTVRILGDASGFEKTTQIAIKSSESLGKKMAGAFGGIQADRVAQSLVGFGKDSVAAFKESEQSAAQLGFAFEKFPALADSTAASFNKVGEALAKKTKFDDDAVSSGQAVLAQFGLTGKQIEQMTPLLADYAARTGKDLPTAAEDLGKALMGQGRALKEVGIDFKDAGSTGANFEQLMGSLSGAVGGFAEKEGKTAAGQAAILSNQFGEIQETVGQKLLPVLMKLTSVLLGVVSWLQNLSPEVQTAIGVGVALVGAVFLIVKAVQAWTAVQAALNVVMAMNPIALVVIAIVALVAIFVYAYKNCETFRDIVDAAFRGVRDAAVWLWDGIKWTFDRIGAAIGWVIDTAKGIGRAFGSAFETALAMVKAPINGIIWLVNKMIDGINAIKITIPDIPGLPGRGKSFGVNLPNIPQLAEGGIVTGPTLALIGEAGPEAVVPLDGRHGAGANIYITVNGALDAAAVGRQVVGYVEDHLSRGGSITNKRGGQVQIA